MAASNLVELPAERTWEQPHELAEQPAPVSVPEVQRMKRRVMNLLEAEVHDVVVTRCLLRTGCGGSHPW